MMSVWYLPLSLLLSMYVRYVILKSSNVKLTDLNIEQGVALMVNLL